MRKVYLDNAATTQIRSEVAQEMTKVMLEDYGNPSSNHSFGRSAKAILETSRKSIAKLLHCNAQEIIFTSSAPKGFRNYGDWGGIVLLGKLSGISRTVFVPMCKQNFFDVFILKSF